MLRGFWRKHEGNIKERRRKKKKRRSEEERNTYDKRKKRIFSKSKTTDEDASFLSEHEKQELMESLQDTIDTIQNESDNINDIKQKYKN